MEFGYKSAFVAAITLTALMFSGVGHTAYSEIRPLRPKLEWAPPSWYPTTDSLTVLTTMTGEVTHPLKVAGIRAKSVYVFDLDAGEVLFTRAADAPLPVASLTKLTTGLALASEEPNLDSEWCITKDFWPSRPGARSKFSTGDCYQGWDLFGAALVASDNRGAYGMQIASGLPFTIFIARMNEVSEELGMDHSSWSDPSGLEDDNLSSARDMAKAAVAVAFHPQLSLAATAPQWYIERIDSHQQRWLGSTVRLTSRQDLEVLSGKTGYTDTAGYCFAGVVELASGRRLAISVLGAPSSGARWSDVEKLIATFGDS